MIAMTNSLYGKYVFLIENACFSDADCDTCPEDPVCLNILSHMVKRYGMDDEGSLDYEE